MPADDDTLNDKARALLSARADEFHSALRRGRSVDWDSYIGDLTGSVREAVLVELVHIDLEHRAKAGEKPRLEEYIKRFPDLGPASRVPTKLIVEEFRCRVAAGEQPQVSTYRERFPDQYEQVRQPLESLASSTVQKSTTGSGTHALESGRTVSEQYELIKQLGRGMFGEVWLAKKNPSGIEKAIKILLQPMDMDSAQRELRSLELIKNLRHPYLLATEDFWVSDSRLHIAMELADSTVKARLKSCQAVGMGAIPVEEAIQYCAEAAEGLDYLHEHKVMHRDVKPDNILLLRGHAKVADFGLARQQDQVMASMTFAGTPAYMAPEVWGGEGGPASDQYSLALVYAELRQGKSLLKIGPMSEMMLAHLDGKFDFADFIPEEERAVVRRALSKAPADRYPTCLQFAVDLSRTMGRNSMRAPSMARAMSRSGSISNSSTSRSMAATQSVGVFDQSTTKTHIPTQSAGNTKVKSGTVANTAAVRSFVGKRPVQAGPNKKLIAGILAVVLVSVAGVLAFLLFGPSPTPAMTASTDPNTATTTTPTTNDTQPTTNTIPPPTTKPLLSAALPLNSTAEPGVKPVKLFDGRTFPEWITFSVNGETVRFRLIASPSVPAFYIMESKVWTTLFKGSGNANDPVFNIAQAEAMAFAKQKFGGAIPTPEQWDAAAGATMITRPGGKPVINQAVPGPTHGPAKSTDVNENDLIDMAGNGWEWTTGKVTPPAGKEKAILRGRNYTFAQPLTPALLKDEQTSPFTQYPEKGSPYTSFRVVVPLP